MIPERHNLHPIATLFRVGHDRLEERLAGLPQQ
jgi:hypothetical protein